MNYLKNYYTNENGELFSRRLKRQIGKTINYWGYYVTSIKTDGKIRTIATHRIIFALLHGKMPRFIDHIDGNKLNNKPENLREVTPQQSVMNRGKAKNKSSKYKGVHYFKRDRKWDAQYRINGKSFHIGRFNTEKEAAIAYNNKVLEVFGEYARLNII